MTESHACSLYDSFSELQASWLDLCLFSSLIVMYFILPETEQRSFEDIELHFSNNSKGITEMFGSLLLSLLMCYFKLLNIYSRHSHKFIQTYTLCRLLRLWVNETKDSVDVFLNCNGFVVSVRILFFINPQRVQARTAQVSCSIQ